MSTSSRNATPEPGRRRVHPQPERGGERVARRAQQLGGLARADRALDTDRRGLAERHLDAEVTGQHRLDDLLLHLPVERDRQLAGRLPDVDQRVLLGELHQGDVQSGPVGGPAGRYDRFQRRRGELRLDGPW